MPIVYKINILEALKAAGYSSYRIRKENIFAQYTVGQFRKGELVPWSTFEKVCALLNCQPGDIVRYIPDGEGETPPEPLPPKDPPKEPPRPKVEPKQAIFPFVEFWRVYPKKKAKQDAIRAWEKLKPDETLGNAIIKAVEAQKLTPGWLKDGGAYIPHPATYLNGRRWEDEESTGSTPSNEPEELGYWVGTVL